MNVEKENKEKLLNTPSQLPKHKLHNAVHYNTNNIKSKSVFSDSRMPVLLKN